MITQQEATDDATATVAGKTSEPQTLSIPKSLLLIFGVFLFMHIPIAVGYVTSEPAVQNAGPSESLLDSNTWGRFDTWFYLDIAKGGYWFNKCDTPLYSKEEWCGTVAWTPVFPGLIRFTTYLGVQKETAGYLLTRVFTLAMLGVLWFLFFQRRFNARTVGALLLASVWPGAIYLLGIFPMSLAVTLSLLTIYFLAKERPLLAGLFAGLASTSHTAGLYISLAVPIYLAIEYRHELSRAFKMAVLYIIPVIACIGAMLLTFQVTVGYWNANLLAQKKYEHSLLFPPKFLYRRFRVLWSTPPDTSVGPAVQGLLVALIMGGVLVAAILLWKRLDRFEKLAALVAITFWVLPLVYGGGPVDAYYRAEVLTLPAVVLFRRLRPAALYPLVAVCTIVLVVMTRLYFGGILV